MDRILPQGSPGAAGIAPNLMSLDLDTCSEEHREPIERLIERVRESPPVCPEG